jgi:hypothetical protein
MSDNPIAEAIRSTAIPALIEVTQEFVVKLFGPAAEEGGELMRDFAGVAGGADATSLAGEGDETPGAAVPAAGRAKPWARRLLVREARKSSWTQWFGEGGAYADSTPDSRRTTAATSYSDTGSRNSNRFPNGSET